MFSEKLQLHIEKNILTEYFPNNPINISKTMQNLLKLNYLLLSLESFIDVSH